VSRTYTADDLLATSAYSTGESYAFAYTPAHRLSSVTDAVGRALAFTYNPVGWLLSATDTSGGQSFATAYAYDEAGRVTSLDSDAAPALTYAFDLAGRLTSLESSGAVATFSSDAAGARTGAALPNGAVTSYAYDAAGRIENIVTTAASGVIAESYTRDGAGRVTADSSGAYAYDDAGRLKTWTAPAGEVTTYTYDAASNLTGASTDGSATAGFTVDAADRITSPGFSYDDAGNLTSDGDRTFTYDAAGRLTAVADASTETTIAAYAYDAFNRRISATEGTATVFFHYDGASARVIAETDGTGATLASYAYDSAGNLFSMTRGSETYFYHLSARGDVVAMSDSQGAVVNTYTYDPWGAPLTASETVENPYRYASYRYDTSTGLYYCWNRYYAPEFARFLTRDIYPGELSDPVTMNPYLYCGGDPVNRVDPSGMSAKDTLSSLADVVATALSVVKNAGAAAVAPFLEWAGTLADFYTFAQYGKERLGDNAGLEDTYRALYWGDDMRAEWLVEGYEWRRCSPGSGMDADYVRSHIRELGGITELQKDMQASESWNLWIADGAIREIMGGDND
jgi:RHS repeat-associated protein